MYRPKDWKNPLCETCWWLKNNDRSKCQPCTCIFEAGADAILEALRKENWDNLVRIWGDEKTLGN